MELMDAVDEYIPQPVRQNEKPFLMPIEDIFSITGRGTVVTGRIETGTIHVNDPVELVGFGDAPRSTVVTGVEMFRKLLDQGEAGDNVGLLLRGIDKKEVKRGEVSPSQALSLLTSTSRLRSTSSRKKRVDVTLHSTTTIVLSSSSVPSMLPVRSPFQRESRWLCQAITLRSTFSSSLL